MNALTFRALRMLAHGDFRSGEAMARALGVSRASIWNALQALDEIGIEVFRVRGRGYRLSEPLTLLDPQAIELALGCVASYFNLEVLDRVDSTNTLLMQRAAAGTASGTVVAAEWQTQGRGRRGREWHALPGATLTFSLLWRFAQGAGFLAGLSLAVGLAIARAIARCGVQDGGLKWPNDVIWRGRKLGGVLIEMHGDMLGPSAAVIGIGLNCRMPRSLLGRIDQPVVDLATAAKANVDRNAVLASVLRELHPVLTAFAKEGFAPLRTEWQRCHLYHGKAVEVIMPDGGVVNGTVQGVADDGALLLTTGAGTLRLHSGDVSLRATTPAPVSA